MRLNFSIKVLLYSVIWLFEMLLKIMLLTTFRNGKYNVMADVPTLGVFRLRVGFLWCRVCSERFSRLITDCPQPPPPSHPSQNITYFMHLPSPAD